MGIICLMGISWAVSSGQALSTCHPASGHPGSQRGLLSDILVRPAMLRLRGHPRDAWVGLPAARHRAPSSRERGSPALPTPLHPTLSGPGQGLWDHNRWGAALHTVPCVSPWRLSPRCLLQRVQNRLLGSAWSPTEAGG